MSQEQYLFTCSVQGIVGDMQTCKHQLRKAAEKSAAFTQRTKYA